MRQSIKILACLMTAAWSGPCLASSLGYEVITQTSTDAIEFFTGQANYNAPSTGTGAYFSTSPTGSTVSGTTDTTGTATSAFDNNTSSGNNGGGSVTSTADVNASLATGSVGVKAVDNAIHNGVCCGGSNFASESASAQISDTLTFHVAGANSGTVTPITVSYSANGTFGATSSFGTGTFTSTLTLSGSTSNSAVTTYNLNVATGGGPVSFGSSYSYGWANGAPGLNGPGQSGVWTRQTASGNQWQGVYDLVGATDVVTLTLAANCIDIGDGFTCDFLDPPSIGLPNLRSDVSFTSASGAFLTATPVPATLPLLASGLGSLGLFGWRRKRKAQAVAA